MQGFINWLEKSFAPKMNKVSNNIWVVTIKDSVMQILPFILLGSLFCFGTIFEGYLNLPFSFWSLFGWTMGIVSVLVAFLIPLNFCERKRIRKLRLVAAGAGLILFFITITPILIEEQAVGFSSSAFGAGGMFVAIVTGVIVCIVFNAFANFSFFKEDSAMPEFVRQWFDVLLPLTIIVFGGFLLVSVANFNLFGVINNIFMPLQEVLNTWYGFTFMSFLVCFVYSMGISGWVFSAIDTPIKIQSVALNMALVAAGTQTVENMQMYTQTTIFVAYMWIGGIGCTLPLVFLLLKSKATNLKVLGRACLAPAICNINEPVVFGCIAWNPLLMIPMWINGIVIPLMTYIACKVILFAPIPEIQFDLWYCPYPIGTWIATQGSIKAVIFVGITFAVSTAIWYPFFKVYEKQCIANELAAE